MKTDFPSQILIIIITTPDIKTKTNKHNRKKKNNKEINNRYKATTRNLKKNHNGSYGRESNIKDS